MRFLPLFVSRRRFEIELHQKSKALCDRLALEIERTLINARKNMTRLSKESILISNKASIRLLAIQLIQEHNRIDVFRILHQGSHLILNNVSTISLSKSLPTEKELTSAIETVIIASFHFTLFEIKDLVNLFRRVYGDKVVNRAQTNSNSANVSKERIVSKLTTEIEESLIQQYLQVIMTPPHPDKTIVPTMNQKNPIGTKKSDPQSGGILNSTFDNQVVPSHIHCPTFSCRTPKTPQAPQGGSTFSIVSISKLAPTLPIRIFRPNHRLEIAFDVRTKNPIYVMERLDGLPKTKPPTRPKFYEEEHLPQEYRSTLCSFLQSGYDRGHMAPAADFGADSVKDTFNLCNVSPQDQTMNRSIWVKLENWCRQVAKRELATMEENVVAHVVTGPVWIPINHPSNKKGQHLFHFAALGEGDTMMHVPTHFFKVIVVSNADQIRKFACFLIPNNQKSIGGNSTTLEQFFIRWDRLETITGLQFFPTIATPEWKLLARKATDSMLFGETQVERNDSCDRSLPIPLPISPLEHLRIGN